MTLGIRARLLLISVAVVAVVEIIAGAFLQAQLRIVLESRMAEELARHAVTAAETAEVAAIPVDVASADALTDRLASATQSRVTLIAPDGRVMGDSALDPPEIEAVENHGQRPEVTAALEGRVGQSRRYSTTLEQDMMYAAAPIGSGPHRGGVVRAATSLATVEAAIGEMRRVLWAVGALMLAGVGLLVGLTSKWITNRLLRLLRLAVREDSGQHALAGAVRDVDAVGLARELKDTMDTLSRERDRFVAVLNAMEEAVLVLDVEGRLSLVNPAARNLLNLTADPIGRRLLEAVRIPALKELVDDAASGQIGSVEFDLPGSGRQVLASARPHASSGGTLTVLRDVSKLRQLERVRRDFVANVSHELRTPVGIMRVNAETLLDGNLRPEESKRFLSALMRNADRLTRLVSDLLDISRIEAGKYDTEVVPTDLYGQVQRAAELAATSAREKGSKLTVNVSEDLEVMADAKALDQVLTNLIENAIKYTPAGGEIAVQSRVQDDGFVRVSIVDDGPGIEPHHRKRIFERFYRVDPGRSREMGGTGLGLSIVKHLAESMEGEVGVEPRSPHGSEFWFTLRQAPAQSPDLGVSASVAP